MRRLTIASVVAGMLVLAGCSDIKNTLNDWTRQVVHVTYKTDSLQMTGDACTKAFAVDDVLSSAGGYAGTGSCRKDRLTAEITLARGHRWFVPKRVSVLQEFSNISHWCLPYKL